MDPATASIIVALIGLFGTVFGIAAKQFSVLRKENRADHGVVMGKLDEVQEGIRHVSERLDDHIGWHLKKK